MNHPIGAGTATGEHATAACMRVLLERAPLAMAFTRDGRFVVVSEHMNHLFGHGSDAGLAGQETRVAQVSDAAHAMVGERMAVAFVAGRPLDEEIEYVRHDGSRFWGRLQATPVHWDAPKQDALWLIEDVTQARQLRLQPTWIGRHEPVTELANRREFQRRLAEHVGSQRRTPVAVLWLEIDHFADVTSRFGAEAANRFLHMLGELMVTKVRASDIVGNFELDRFAVLLPECDQHHAQLVAEKLRAGIAGFRLRWGVQSTKLKACVGVVQLHASLAGVDAVLDAASQACEAAKASGGDCVRVHVPEGASDTQMSALD